MAQKKTNEVEAWLRRPDPAVSVILLYGPDRGMVSERARALAGGLGVAVDDPFSVVRLSADELDADPGRLVEEAQTVPMFADKRLVWVKNAGTQKRLADELKLLLEAPSAQTVILIEAGELKKGVALRSLVEGAPSAMALPCYADEGRSIDAIIDEELGKSGLIISLEARHLLRSNLGGDRLATRGEVEKLALYCLGRGHIDVEDVRLMTGDVSGRSLDDAVDAVLSGDRDRFDLAYTQLVASGGQPFLALASAMRQFQQMQNLRNDMDRQGRTAAAAVASAKPPVFFARRKLFEAALQARSAAIITRGLERLQGAVLATRQRPELAAAIARQALLALMAEGQRGRR